MNNYNNYTNNNTYVNVETNPDMYKTESQIQFEIEKLEERISKNKALLNSVNDINRVEIENMITQDEIKVSQLYMTLEQKKKILRVAYIF